jgi:hypothetical protein
VIIHNLNVVGVAAAPPKADTPPIADPDAVLPGTVARQLLEPVAGRDSQVIQRFGRVENEKLSLGRPLEISGPSPNDLAAEQPFGVPVGKVADHLLSITLVVIVVKRYYPAV